MTGPLPGTDGPAVGADGPAYQVWALPGLPEVKPGDDLAKLIASASPVSRTETSCSSRPRS